MSEARAQALDHALTTLDVTDRLLLVRREVDGPLILTTSFGLEDQVLTHVIAETRLDVELATLDTGRLFPQTYGSGRKRKSAMAFGSIRSHPIIGSLRN